MFIDAERWVVATVVGVSLSMLTDYTCMLHTPQGVPPMWGGPGIQAELNAVRQCVSCGCVSR